MRLGGDGLPGLHAHGQTRQVLGEEGGIGGSGDCDDLSAFWSSLEQYRRSIVTGRSVLMPDTSRRLFLEPRRCPNSTSERLLRPMIPAALQFHMQCVVVQGEIDLPWRMAETPTR